MTHFHRIRGSARRLVPYAAAAVVAGALGAATRPTPPTSTTSTRLPAAKPPGRPLSGG